MKAGTLHIVPLSRQALAVLREIHPMTGHGRYVFPSPRADKRPMSSNAVLSALRRMGYAKDEMIGHGFRSMASTLLNEQGWNRDAIERQLAHAERNSVRAAYNYADTTGAVYGQIAGAFYGVSGIPAAWLDRLCRRDLIEEMAERLAVSAQMLTPASRPSGGGRPSSGAEAAVRAAVRG